MAERTVSPLRSPTRKQWDSSAVGSDDYLSSLTRRLEVLEKKLIGKRGVRDQPPLKPTIQSLQKKLSDYFGGVNQANIHALWAKIETLEGFLNPNFIKRKSSLSSKEDLLLGYLNQIRAVSEDQGDDLMKLKDYVNTTEFQGLDGHEKKLANVANIHNQQEQKIEETSKQARELVKVYNQIFLQLSAECIEWEALITRLESQKTTNSQN